MQAATKSREGQWPLWPKFLWKLTLVAFSKWPLKLSIWVKYVLRTACHPWQLSTPLLLDLPTRLRTCEMNLLLLPSWVEQTCVKPLHLALKEKKWSHPDLSGARSEGFDSKGERTQLLKGRRGCSG